MKLYKVLSLLVCLFLLFSGMAFGKALTLIGEINKEQPISIGEEIYKAAVGFEPENDWERGLGRYPFYTHIVSYTYMGLDDKNNVKVIYKHKYNPFQQWYKRQMEALFPPKRRQTITRDWDKTIVEEEVIPPAQSQETPKEETLNLTLPLNPKKQTILKVKSFEGTPHPMQMIITPKELIITVVDEFNRIIVEETGKIQTK